MPFIEPQTERYFQCPICYSYKFNLEHGFTSAKEYNNIYTYDKTFCKECGQGFKLIFYPDNAFMFLAIEKKENHIGIILSRDVSINGKIQTLYVCVTRSISPTLVSSTLDLIQVHRDFKYYYEQYICPDNYLTNSNILIGHDHDPHGLFKYEGFIDIDAKVETEIRDWFSKLEDDQALLKNMNICPPEVT